MNQNAQKFIQQYLCTSLNVPSFLFYSYVTELPWARQAIWFSESEDKLDKFFIFIHWLPFNPHGNINKTLLAYALLVAVMLVANLKKF